jgi:uncharacterized protein YggT (Ycf19 family)
VSGSVGFWVRQALWLYEMVIFAYALSSWFAGNATARSINVALAKVCEPYVGLIRRILPSQMAGSSGVDLAPLVAMLLLIVAQSLIR